MRQAPLVSIPGPSRHSIAPPLVPPLSLDADRLPLRFSASGSASCSTARTDEFLRREAEVVGDAPELQITGRDKDDIGIVEQAGADGAHVFVTGDRDIIEMGEDEPLPILTPRGFWDLLRSDSKATLVDLPEHEAGLVRRAESSYGSIRTASPRRHGDFPPGGGDSR